MAYILTRGALAVQKNCAHHSQTPHIIHLISEFKWYPEDDKSFLR